jgi:hypothetical protein
MHNAPIPNNELERLLNLSDFDIDYSNQQEILRILPSWPPKLPEQKFLW